MRVAVTNLALEVPAGPYPPTVAAALERCAGVHESYERDRAALADAEAALTEARSALDEALVSQKLGQKADTAAPSKAVAAAEAEVAKARHHVQACEVAGQRTLDQLLDAVVEVAPMWSTALEERQRHDIEAARAAIAQVADSVTDLYTQRSAIDWLRRLTTSPGNRYALARRLIAATPPTRMLQPIGDVASALDELDRHAHPDDTVVADRGELVRL
jgi:hypothetical protein